MSNPSLLISNSTRRMIEIARRGHEVGCHSYGHPEVFKLSREEFRDDCRRALDALAAAGVAQVPDEAIRSGFGAVSRTRFASSSCRPSSASSYIRIRCSTRRASSTQQSEYS